MFVKRLPIILLLTAFVIGCRPSTDALLMYKGETMGTYFSVQWQSTSTQQERTIREDIDRALLKLNQSMSTYIDDSEISRFNRVPVGVEVEISNYFADVVHLALEISRLTHGAFDFTVAPLVNLWGFGPLETDGKPPDEEVIQAQLHSVGYQHIHLNESERRLFKQKAATIDLSAIAKGYAVDVLGGVMEDAGVVHYLVEIGGELRAAGVKPDGLPWRVGIESPVAGERGVQLGIEIGDISVATSGDYRNYFEEQGVRYSHAIDPVTGKPVRHNLVSVTVLSPDCARADALATALLVMGPDRGLLFAEQHGLAAYFIVKTKAGFEAHWSSGFTSYLE